MKQDTVKYNEFSRLYLKDSMDGECAIVFLATTSKHYRLTKYLADKVRADQFVSAVNHWWTVERLEQREKMYSNRTLMIRKYSNQHSPKNEQKEEEQPPEVEEKTEQDIYWENHKELEALIRKLKYKSFGERDIENACRLKEHFDSKYRVKMVEEYQNIKAEMEQRKSADRGNEELEMILKNADRYIASALLLKLNTVDTLIAQRKVSKSILETMTDENKLREEVYEDVVAEEV